MKYTKVDVVFLGFFAAPITLVASMFAVGAMRWKGNQVSPDDLGSQRAKWDELVLSLLFVSQWLDSQEQLQTEEEDYQIVPPNHSSELTERLSQIVRSTTPLLEQVDELLQSSDASLPRVMKDRINYDGVRNGDLENIPIFVLYRHCHLAFRQSIVADDPDQALKSLNRILDLLVQPPLASESSFYLQSILISVRESVVFEFWQLEQFRQIHERLGESWDFADTIEKQQLTENSLVATALQDSRSLSQLQSLNGIQATGDRQQLFSASTGVAPSQTLQILKPIYPGSQPMQFFRSGFDFDYDCWLQRPSMRTVDLKVRIGSYGASLRTSVELTHRDRVFTRAAVAARMIRLEAGRYPADLNELESLEWSEEEIAQAKRLLKIERDSATGDVRLIPVYASGKQDVVFSLAKDSE